MISHDRFPRRRLAAADRMDAERQPAQARAGGRGRRARLRAPARGATKRSGASSRCCTTSTTSAIRRSAIIPNKGCEHLRALGYPEWVMRAILSHASEITGIEPETPLERTLVACDEMAGFVTAASLVRPSKSVLDLEGVVGHQAHEGQGVRPRGAARSPAPGAELMGLPLDQHITNVIAFMRRRPTPWGCGGRSKRAKPAGFATSSFPYTSRACRSRPAGNSPPSAASPGSPAPSIPPVRSSSAISSAFATARTGR